MTSPRLALRGLALVAGAALLLTGCVAGEGSDQADNAATDVADGATSDAATDAATDAADGAATEWSADTLSIDWATYNPLSLVVKENHYLEDTLGDAVTVEWVQSAGSNKANEALRAGAIDVGSTAGSAALLARANGSPIHTIAIYSQPEWSALVVPAGSDITSVADLKGESVAVTKGTDPYFFLLQALETAGLTADDITIQNLQHADGKAALENGSVDAWSGLDPLMAASEETAGSTLIYRNIDFNTYGFLNATQDFLDASPDLAQIVVDAYAKAQEWAAENPDELVNLLAEAAQIDPAVASTVITERTNLEVSQVPGQAQLDVLTIVAPILVSNGDVATQDAVDDALDALIDPTFAEKADPSTITE
ncbi:aliphatic sulfonate ABC transporter substrate-binding protein [Miniimonas arenae]|uniref:Putative aliphatic sulfonates-binding protein n=1 Tax=Miniimonas arenae TaxID=676201 RepID=A0A5C5BBA1_9MICO|nr:aliphatic sulfonate ABC transporter substrate-binding protein [Miniimonas arenae]TNU73332.1 aliphatic sulfonate ABC transporter substrate-binding protein [Miniimonas arenae]